MRLHFLPVPLLTLLLLFSSFVAPVVGWSCQQEYGDSPRPVPSPRVRLSMGTAQARLKKLVQPEYPPAAKRDGIEGDVTFKVVIGEDGRVKETELKSGNPTFAKVAAKAISEWEYRPTCLTGRPRKSRLLSQYSFVCPWFASLRFRITIETRRSQPRRIVSVIAILQQLLVVRLAVFLVPSYP
jgi:TonB family protein